MARARHLSVLLAFVLLSTYGQAQVYAKKRLVSTVGGGGGGLVFTQGNGPSDLMRGSSLVNCGVQYGVGKRIGVGFRYERLSARRGILEAGPSRTASYALDLHVVIARWERTELDLSAGAGFAITALSAQTGRLPREARGGLITGGIRWSKTLSPTLGFFLGGRACAAEPQAISDERGHVLLDNGQPLKVGFYALGVEAGVLVRF
jgi:hypothetical protein